MSVAEVHQALGLEALKNRTFQVNFTIQLQFPTQINPTNRLDIQNIGHKG